jgi:multiple sugar transport system permease protein
MSTAAAPQAPAAPAPGLLARLLGGGHPLMGHLHWYFVAPAVLLLLLVIVVPIGYSAWVSVHQTGYLNVRGFIGGGNYVALFTDPAFWRNALVSLMYVLGSLAIALPLGLALAMATSRPLPLIEFFSAACMVPWVISQTAAALLWVWLLDPAFGPVNYVLEQVGIGRINFTADPQSALPTLIWVNAWMTYPLAMILFTAGLQTISSELYEAARIDGASPWVCFISITLPLLRSTALSAAIILTLYYFTMVTLILILTGGGPIQSTEVLSLRVFNETFQYWRVGVASALGIVIFMFNAAFTLLYMRVIGRTAGVSK